MRHVYKAPCAPSVLFKLHFVYDTCKDNFVVNLMLSLKFGGLSVCDFGFGS
jgi:hypothetical protein